MIEAIVRSQLDDRDDFCAKIPEWLRTGTDGRQMRYLDEICELVSEYLRTTRPGKGSKQRPDRAIAVGLQRQLGDPMLGPQGVEHGRT